MTSKRMLLCACFVGLVLLLVSPTNASEDRVIFDGDTKSEGKSWAEPKKAGTKLTLSTNGPLAGEKHLQFDAKWDNWFAGFGWNWAGYYDAKKTKRVNISQYRSLTFFIKVASGNVKDINIALVDVKGKTYRITGLVKKGYYGEVSSNYTKVVVPLNVQKIHEAGIDVAQIWEVNFDIATTTKAGSARIFFDKIAFTGFDSSATIYKPIPKKKKKKKIIPGPGAKLNAVQVLDQNYLTVHVIDGEVVFRDNGEGNGAYGSAVHTKGHDKVVYYHPGLNQKASTVVGNWKLSSTDDADFGAGGVAPVACHRKTKVNGLSEQEWGDSDYEYEFTLEHFIYLKLPKALKQGKTYTLTIAPDVKTEKKTATFTYDIFKSRSEAVHVNLVGYLAKAPSKAADLYHWMGDGGPRDYKAFEGKSVLLYNVKANTSKKVGTVSFWKKSQKDIHKNHFDLTKSNVWTIDMAGQTAPGTYRLAVEGVGCSQDFEIRDTVYYAPFKVGVKGYYYMRIGEEKREDIKPVPRQPRYIPGKAPANCKVYLTTMHPYHPKYKGLIDADKWDKPHVWKPYVKPGNPTNPNAWGGHSDALDWDRHLGHVVNIYDMLLPYILTGGAQDDDNLGITESGNGIPDLLDEARNEVDFFLRLRDGKGYSHGLTNPNSKNELFQAAPTAVAAWANAANAAMLADCFRINGNKKLMKYYTDEGVIAYTHASGLADQQLDKTVGKKLRGRDLKMMAAAYLYNVTGNKKYEDAVKAESACTGPAATIYGKKLDQTWATVGYLKTPQKVNYPGLASNMKASLMHNARTLEANLSTTRTTRRAAKDSTLWFRTTQDVQLSMAAHAISDTQKDKDFFLKALALEADYGLGRNPLNMIQMTTATTLLAKKRSVENAYTTGWNDGTPGVHPGHTPYMNLFDWGSGMTMNMPSKVLEQCYPSDFVKTWPHGEGYFNIRYIYAYGEFTPQQTMRGKIALYAYLYGIGKKIFQK